MLPSNGQLTDEPFPSSWFYPHPTEFDPLIDYEMGGVALQNPSQGLDVQLWKLRYHEQQIKISKTSDPGTEIGLFIVPNLIRLALAFDQNMNPCYAWENGAEGYCNLIFYDTLVGANTVLTFNGITNPCLTLDDHRRGETATSDIIFAYVRDGNLCYRQQRDRFDVEYVQTEVQGELIRVGMSSGSRLQFMSRYYQRPPT